MRRLVPLRSTSCRYINVEKVKVGGLLHISKFAESRTTLGRTRGRQQVFRTLINRKDYETTRQHQR